MSQSSVLRIDLEGTMWELRGFGVNTFSQETVAKLAKYLSSEELNNFAIRQTIIPNCYVWKNPRRNVITFLENRGTISSENALFITIEKTLNGCESIYSEALSCNIFGKNHPHIITLDDVSKFYLEVNI